VGVDLPNCRLQQFHRERIAKKGLSGSRNLQCDLISVLRRERERKMKLEMSKNGLTGFSRKEVGMLSKGRDLQGAGNCDGDQGQEKPTEGKKSPHRA